MKLPKFLLLAIATIFIASCAKHPDDIEPKNIPASSFQELSCSGLTLSYRNHQEALAGFEKMQKSTRSWHIAGVTLGTLFIINPWWFFALLTPDVEEEIAATRGRMDAIKANIYRKKC